MRNCSKFLFVSLFLFIFLMPAYAQVSEIDLLKRQVKEMQESYNKKIEELQNRINALESGQKQPPLQELQEKVKALELQQKEPQEGIFSELGDKIQFGGEARVQFTAAQDQASDNTNSFKANEHGRFELDKLRLKIMVSPQENIELKTKLDFEGEDDKVTVKEGYLAFKGIDPFDQKLYLGLKLRFIDDTIERYTGFYPFAETAFYRYGDVGLQYYGKASPFYWRLSVANGPVLKTREIGEDSATRDKIMRDDKGYTDGNNNKQVGVGLGFENKLGKLGIIDLLGFGYFSKLPAGNVSNDITKATDFALLTNANFFPDRPVNTTDKTQSRVGAGLVYTKDAFEAAAQYIRAQDSYLRRHVWFVQSTYTFDTNFKYLQAIQPLFRFDQYLVQTGRRVANPLTWDRSRYTIGLLNHIRKDSLILKLEYALNFENTGGDDPKNDELLMQLEYSF